MSVLFCAIPVPLEFSLHLVPRALGPTILLLAYFAGLRTFESARGKFFLYVFLFTRFGLTRDFLYPRGGFRVARHSEYLGHPVKTHGNADSIFFYGNSTNRNGLLCMYPSCRITAYCSRHICFY